MAKDLEAQFIPMPLAKVEDTKELTKFLSLTLSRPTVIFAQDIQDSSTETMNAFLKLLEEPQEELTFILAATSESTILPTIISRCQLILTERNHDSSFDPKIAESFVDSKTSIRFETLTNLKSKDDAIHFLENLMLGLHKKILKEGVSKLPIAGMLESAEKTLSSIKKNGNVAAQLINFGVQTHLISPGLENSGRV